MKKTHTWVSEDIVITTRVTVIEKRLPSCWVAKPRDSNILDGSSRRGQWNPIFGVCTGTLGYADSNVVHHLNIRYQ